MTFDSTCQNLGCCNPTDENLVCLVSSLSSTLVCSWACAADFAVRQHFTQPQVEKNQTVEPPRSMIATIPQQTRAMLSDPPLSDSEGEVDLHHPELPPSLTRP